MSATLEEYRARLREALTVINDLKARVQASERARSEPIAIVGIGCRFPGGGGSPEGFWRSIQRGVDAVREIPETRWPAGAIPGNRPETRWSALLDDIEGFDAGFFGISPREAASLDPQQRLLLEVAWEALEDGGQRPDLLAGSRTGVFVGLAILDYQQRLVAAGMDALDTHSLTGNIASTAAGRLSFVLGLQGPCATVDTACSSSLVAMHLACHSLRNGECSVALAGGVNAIVSPYTMAMLAQTHAISSDGRCKTFDARADGYVRGEGCGVLVLKRLSDAQRDGDHIRALIRGSAMNQDGRSTGLTTPNVLSQQALLEQALESARVPAEVIGYVEAHGTGTPLGDPIEYDALKAVLGQPRANGAPCVLGAVKTNIGHLEAAAGVAGVVKAVLSLEHEEIPKNLHFRVLNPRIDVEDTPFLIPTENVPWRRGEAPRYAGVSSFGMSGTNAHVILQEAPAEEPQRPREEARAYLLPLSAKSPEALVAQARAYEELLASGEDAGIGDILYTASVRRMHHEHRLAAVGRTRQELAQALGALARGEYPGNALRGKAPTQGAPKVVFVFSGQGSQWAGMGAGLLREEPLFRAKIEECSALLRRYVPWSLLDELTAPEERSRLRETEVVQPALLALQVALAELLRSWGVVPDAVLGHSVGEIAAAHIAGALSLEEALRLAALRGRIMQQATGRGKMAYVGLAPEQAALAIAGREERLAIAAVNDPQSVVLSGDAAELEAVLAELAARGVSARPLHVNYAFHSPQMAPLARELVEALGHVDARASAIALYSTVTGAPIEGGALEASYWGRNVRETVNLARAVEAAIGDGGRMFVEVGPHPVLLANLQQCISPREDVHVTSSLRRHGDELRCMLEVVGALHAHGVDIDWSRLHPAGGRCVSLPVYPWQKQRYWIEEAAPARPAADAEDPLHGCVHELRWRKKDRAAGRRSSAAGAWLLFSDHGGTGEALAALLRERGEPCVLVARGERYEKVGPGSYRIALSNRDDYQRLLADAFREGSPCRGVVHLSSLDAAPWELTTADTLDSDQWSGTFSALHLVQALLRQDWRDKPRLWLVTRGAQVAEEAQSLVSPAQAPLWGFARTLVLEHPELDCVRIDLDPEGSAGDATALAAELDADDGEDQVALRRAGRFVARLVRNGFAASPARALVFGPDASYLVTGGLGGLGLTIARWMVERGARRLALMSRRAPSAAARAEIEAMEAMGAEVLVLAADVAVRADVEAALQAISARLPPLRGIVHAAGIVDDHTLLELSVEHLQRVFAPKMHGAWNLHALTAGQDLDFFVLYSSAASLLGSSGQANYAAANAFLGALARARHCRGQAAMSIHWGPFTGVGLAAAQDNRGGRLSERGLEGLTPEQGNLAMQRLLEHPRAEVGVVRLDVRHWLEFHPQMAVRPYFTELQAASGGEQPRQRFRAALEAAAPSERAALLEAHVREQIGRVLRVDPAALERLAPFRNLGVDSLMSLEVRNRLEASLQARLPATLLFTYPTLASLTESLFREMGLSEVEDAAASQAGAEVAAVELRRREDEPIAIVGMACRFPGGGHDPEAFWRMLLEGADAVREAAPARWPREMIPADKPGGRYAALLDEVDRFDASFFGISPREAEVLDPQQRLLLEVAWEALEDAGQRADALTGSRTGVFVGISALDYQRLVMSGTEHLDVYGGMGNMLASAAGRLSYVLGLQGPAVALDTACSSSLVAVHLACQSLREGDSDMALAGGVNALLSWQTMMTLVNMQALSPDGRCKTFDARANGYVRGEGCGVLVLKRLSDAQRDKDPILALIRGSAVNQDGRSTGFTAPNVLAQEALLRQAYERARVAPEEIGYIEMHGTGTPLGDPIEADALKKVLGAPRPDGARCVLGAVKTNIGHLEAAAGVAGLIKTVQVLRHGLIPKNIHFRALNPRISLEGTPLAIAAQNVPWTRGQKPRLAGVSSFGISGTNAHVVLEEAPPAPAPVESPAQSAYLLPLSAKRPEALAALARSWAERLAAEDGDSLADIAHTASSRRAHHSHRLAAVGGSREELAQALFEHARGTGSASVVQGKVSPQGVPKVVFVFPGQGSQWLGMGRQLLAEEEVFRSALEACDLAIQQEAGFSVIAELTCDEPLSRLAHIDVVQPVLFAFQVALCALWRSWGIRPDCVVGHSMGEVAAAHVAGLLTLQDACSIICRRSKLLTRISGMGAMALVELSMQEASHALAGYQDRVSVAVSNGPRSTVLSGEPQALELIVASLEQRGVFCRRVKVDVASHSPQVEPLQQDLRLALAALSPGDGQIPMLSTVTLQRLQGSSLHADYWWQNLRAPVRFSEATLSLIHDGSLLFLELSPHPILLPAIEENLREARVEGSAIASLRRQAPERRTLLEGLGSLYARGCSIAWERLYTGSQRCVQLPPYPWLRERFWLDKQPQAAMPPLEAAHPGQHPLLGRSFTTSARPGARLWQSTLRLADLPYLADHRIAGSIVLPASAYIEAALAAARERFGASSIVLEEMAFLHPLVLPESEPVTVEVALEPETAEAFSFRLSSLTRGAPGSAPGADPEWTLHAKARLRSGAAESPGPSPQSIEEMKQRFATRVPVDALERAQARHGLEIGPAFSGVREILREGPEVLAKVRLPEGVALTDAYAVHPALLDAALRSPAVALPEAEARVPRVLATIRRLHHRERAGLEAWSHARVHGAEESAVTLLGDDGRILLEVEGLVTRPFLGQARDPHAEHLYAATWECTDPLPTSSHTGLAGRWLLLCDDQGIGRALRAALVERGAEVVCAWAGGAGQLPTAGESTVDIADPSGVAAWLRDAFRRSQGFTGVIYGCGLRSRPEESLPLEALEAQVARLCGGALHLVQALARLGVRDMPRLWLLSSGAQAIPAEPGGVVVAQAPLCGLGRAIALEHPELRCTRVDLDPDAPERELDSLVRELSASGAEEEIALRAGRRYVARLARAEAPPTATPAVPMNPQATYLIAGGLGSFGLLAAQWLAARGARHLALLDRHEASSQAQRDAIARLESAGVEVHIARADVADRESLARALRDIDARLPPLEGIIHSAGALERAALREQSLGRLRSTLAPKVLGGWNLHEQTLGRKLDFFVLCATIEALLGAPELGGQGAADAYLDALAHHRQRLGLPATSIAWGPISGEGTSGGAALAERTSQHGIEPLTPADGEEIFARALGEGWVQMGAAALDVRRWVESHPEIAASPRFMPLTRAPRGAPGEAARAQDRALIDSLRRSPPADRAALLERFVRQQLAEILRLPPERIGRMDPLRALGIDSLMSLELRNRLEAALGAQLSATLVWSHPNLAAMAEHLLRTVGAQLEAAVVTPEQERAPAPSPATPEPAPPPDDDLLASFDASLRRIQNRRKA
nr:hypothetical protein [Myxococcales bacterium]